MALSAPYTQASRGAIQARVLHENTNQDAQLLEKTISYWAALWRIGCRAPPSPNGTLATAVPAEDHQTTTASVITHDVKQTHWHRSWRETWEEQQNERRRGQASKDTCRGHLIFDHDHEGQPLVR